ncbi:hypothetical protein GCM10007421_36440 [Halopseudomonas oceani]|uniref:N-methyl-D-aspartate receptor NMDAR2C subunit n=1 Tax=Halopseudomonas oceani TaxID=1708783 RepID=A0A2P4EQN8_9GAMM|nr:N-methyl-D-aspartate receptor NMDAR2C subunit [Halopseudomonas oceani]POB00930.1 N-methyl-D-aspartate receptor NMDAR2C subunit [Halopseudomonas oceani]GGE58535.1 hypothetical protein GCM10007421_36440 [Halopseudomonas oceani]
MSQQSAMNAERWVRLMTAWQLGTNPDTFAALLRAYTETGRHYHSAEHVTACLQHLDGCAGRVDNPAEVELALWFHDAIYQPLSSSNEQDSADWAASFLTEQGVDEQLVARVHRLIMVTEHNAPTTTRDEAVLVDIDLAILGAPAAVYELFEQGVRQEYRRVPAPLYRRKRAHVLRGFLERPRLYVSGCLGPEREHQARDNLTRAIAQLEGV